MKKNNVRCLTTTFVTASLLACSQSYALGIGEMKLQSALNQNLQAEIALVLDVGEKATDLKISLASNAKFDESGIPWTVFLSKIKFQPITENDQTRIKLSSNEPLKEPFLDFLLEIKGINSTVYREFTVLVDPSPVINQTLATPTPFHFISTPLNPITGKKVYGPIRENETLWNIAAQFNKQNNVSVNRMLAAIFIANPEAFFPRHTDSLIAGQMLKIPSFVESPTLFAIPKKVLIKHFTPVVKPKMVFAKEKSVTISKMNNNSPIKSETHSSKKVAELEQQLSAMQKMLTEKEQQMAALKSPTDMNQISPLTSFSLKSGGEPLVTTNAVITPSITSVTSEFPITTSNFSEMIKHYLDVSADMYSYIIGGVGSLLLGIFGLFRLREREKSKIVTKILEKNNVTPAENEAFNKQNMEFNGNIFSDFSHNESEKMDDILFKVDVYCTYGNIGKAEQLLLDEFAVDSNKHHYALRLLRLYEANDAKEAFKDFMLELVKLGKNKELNFWTEVSNLAKEFYPEALFLISQSNDFSHDKTADFDDKEIVFGEMKLDDTIDKATADFFESSLQFEYKKSSIDFGGFEMSETAETEEPKKELELDFYEFEIDETASSMLEHPKEELDFSLDFHKFGLDEAELSALEKPKEKLDFSLDFHEFKIDETESPTFEKPKEELDFSLDSHELKIEEMASPVFEKPKEELNFSLDFHEFEMAEIEKPIRHLEKMDFTEEELPRINFEKVRERIEENVAQIHLNLAQLHDDEKETSLNYLDMSDSEFADALAAEVLRKCEIKEQLCRQKIAQEVLNKLR